MPLSPTGATYVDLEIPEGIDVDWELDTDGDDIGDFRAYIVFIDGGITGKVADVLTGASGADRRGEVRCTAAATFGGDGYELSFPASCIDDPDQIRSSALINRRTSDGSTYFDFAPNLPANYEEPVGRS